MNDTWIKTYRKSMESSVWLKSPVVWMVWCWCLLKASHKGSKFPFNGDDMEIQPGEFITGRDKATSEMPISTQQWRTAMDYLAKTERLTIKKTNKFSLVTIKNWAEYQASNQPVTNQQPTSNQPVTTYKNDKNVKNDKKVSEAQAPTPSEQMQDFIGSNEKQQAVLNALMAKGLNQDVATRELKKFLDYWTELSKSGKQQRWQLERTFELQRRLVTWFNNAAKFQKREQPRNFVSTNPNL